MNSSKIEYHSIRCGWCGIEIVVNIHDRTKYCSRFCSAKANAKKRRDNKEKKKETAC